MRYRRRRSFSRRRRSMGFGRRRGYPSRRIRLRRRIGFRM